MARRGKSLGWTPEQMDRLVEVTPEDIQAALIAADPETRAELEAAPELDDA